MLKSIFSWLDRHPNSYWFPALGATLLLLAWAWSRLRRETPAGPPARVGWRDYLVLFLFLLAWRWPFLFVAREYNPDESQQIAGALTLAHDPVFWRAVDGTTSGPLNFYALVPLRWLGLPLDYFTARMLGLLFVAGALACCLRTLASRFGAAAAWLGTLPAAAFFATITNPDLIHYSTEHFPMLVAAAAITLVAVPATGDHRRLWAGCCLASALPLTKLQAAPIGLAILCWGVSRAFLDRAPGRGRRVGGAIAAAFVPWVLIGAMVLFTGQAESAVRRYFLHNIYYVEDHFTFSVAWHEMSGLAAMDGRWPILLATAGGALAAATIFYIAWRVRPPALLPVAAGLAVVATIAILTPRRGYLHYTLLLPVPLTLLVGAALGGWWQALADPRARRALGLAALAAGCVLPVATRCRQPTPDIYGEFSYHWTHPRTSAAVVVHALAGKAGSLAVWGWNNSLYVETALPQATRDAHSVWSIVGNAQRDYHRATYLADFRRHPPAVFVDVVGPGSFIFADRTTQGHEIFPELAEEIRQGYKFVTDLGYCRIYARADLPTLADTLRRLDELVAQGRMRTHLFDAIPPTVGNLEHYNYRVVGDQWVMALPPPAQVEWTPEADVRAVTFQFGFDPVAYLRGQTNGAEVVLELVNGGHTRQVFRRFLDPQNQPVDRGQQVAHVVLPAFSAGSRLVLRTTPGPNNDNAWDWTYLAGVQFEHRPAFLPEQFPGFNRVPDAARADFAALIANDDDAPLQLHVPATLVYRLGRGERTLRFDYGLKTGAYTNGGQTDGAVFRVVCEGPGRPAEVLLARHLQPLDHAGDRGRQHVELTLPATRPGDQLVISIGPGPAGNAAWDWTYISRLSIH